MRRYGVVTAVLYDVFSGERPFYRGARRRAIEALRLAEGDRVLVLGCGTGLDLPLLARAIGPTGTIVAVDDSVVMLRRAANRGRTLSGRHRSGWPTVRPVLADLTTARSVLPPDVPAVDAVLAVNTLSLIPAWRRALETGTAAARSGARIAVADIARPRSGHPLLEAWARWISAVGLGDLDARPWRGIEDRVTEVDDWDAWEGHVRMRAATLP